MGYNSDVDDAKETLMDDIVYQLREIGPDDSDRIDLHEIMHEVVDNSVSSNSREDNLAIVDDTGHENTIDDGMIDRTADITTQIAQIAYCCLEQELYNDKFINDLQFTMDGNHVIDYEEAQELIKEIEEH